MKTIFKYHLQTTDYQKIEMLNGAEILCVQNQQETPCIWAIVDKSQTSTQSRTIEIVGTGHPIDESLQRKYIGSYQLQGGIFVFHVFEIINN